MRRAGLIILLSLTSAIILAIIFVMSVRFGLFGRLPGQDDLINYRGATASLVLSEEGEIIGRFFSENRTNVNFEQLPPYLIDALVATEDARFYDHKGLDIRSMLRVAFKTVLLSDRSSGGGSTISQQLAKNIFGRDDYRFLRVPVNKVREIIIALRIGKTFTREEILNLYLNTVSFGENVYGIEAASRRYYNKRVEQLTVDESAVLIGMLKANTRYNPRLYPESAVSRRNVVFRQMEKYRYLKGPAADSLCRLPLALNYLNLESVNPAGYFLVRVRREAEEILQKIGDETGRFWSLDEDGLVINTTLNLKLQDHAIRSFHNHLPLMQTRLREQYTGRAGEMALEKAVQHEMRRLKLEGRSTDTLFMRVFDWEGSFNTYITVSDSIRQALTILHAGILALDPSTGAVKAWVGGIDNHTQPYDQVLARRQMASAFKPVLYAAALEEGISPCRYYDNDSIVGEEFGGWSPANYDHFYGGQYSLAGALSRSMNIPTYHLFQDVGFSQLGYLWKEMGFSFRLVNTPSLALGTAEASLLETAVAYAAFANGGYRTEPYSIVSITTPGGESVYRKNLPFNRARVISPHTASLMSAMLRKAVVEGTGVSLWSTYGVTMPLAGKTGTSQNHADAWFAAFNPALVIVSRAGASTPSIHFNTGAYGSGSSLALPLVALTMQSVQRDRELSSRYWAPMPLLPPGLENALDCPDYREKNFFDRFLDLFKEDSFTIQEQEKETPGRRRSFLRRLLRR